MSLLYEAIIPIDPKTKKNHQQIMRNKKTGKPFVMPSKEYKEYIRQAHYFLRPLQIDFPVNIKCLFYLGTRRKCDLTNLLEAVDDLMVAKGTVVDDNYTIIVGHDGSRVLYDKEHPRTEIYITRVE